MDILREKADDGLAKEIFGAGYDYECDEEYDGQQQLLKKYGYFYFVENGKLGLADKSGHTIIEPEYSRIEISENGQYLKVVQNGLNGIMTIAGEEVIPMVYSEILPLDWNNYGKGLAYDFFGTDDPFVLLAKEERFGVADNKGNLLADVKYEHIWGCDSESDSSVVWTFVSTLRKRLAASGAHVAIRAARGQGYTLEEQA